VHLQIGDAEVAEGERAVGVQVEGALERDDALGALAGVEEGPSQAAEDLGVVGLGPILGARAEEAQDVFAGVALLVQGQRLLGGGLGAGVLPQAELVVRDLLQSRDVLRVLQQEFFQDGERLLVLAGELEVFGLFQAFHGVGREVVGRGHQE
jgi:hypothetical protein